MSGPDYGQPRAGFSSCITAVGSGSIPHQFFLLMTLPSWVVALVFSGAILIALGPADRLVANMCQAGMTRNGIDQALAAKRCAQF